MIAKPHWSAVLLGLFLLVAGCVSAQVTPQSAGSVATHRVTGTVAYRERIALPPTAAVQVTLADVSRADAPAIVLARQVIPTAGRQVPFAFALDFDPATIEPAHTYAVQVRIEDQGKLLFISDTLQPVITRGAPAQVDVIVRAVRPMSGTQSQP